ncbi:MAG: TetR/AcrR family transcriptional regulator [Acidimicrobiales bacterium]|nr:TetR/AcrR family transcriptional regulator [Acidimicrobiales bacterium]HRW37277.1 TetR/AcrR family transcriptional regulator [Aquihabitans sp.]
MSAAAEGSSTRERILAAALAAFAERGVEATSLDAVATAVGVRKQTLLYWFPSKEQLLLGVVDHAVAELGARLTDAVLAAGPELDHRIVAVVDATFRLGTTHPELLAVVREVARLGPPASTRLATSVEPVVSLAAAALARRSGDAVDEARGRSVLLGAGAQVVGIATEAEVRADLGLPADLRWLRTRRRALLASLRASLA